MANVFIESVVDGHLIIEHTDGSEDSRHFKTQKKAVDHGKSQVIRWSRTYPT